MPTDLQLFQNMMNSFGVVTVMNACIYKLKDGVSYVGRGMCAHGETNGGALDPDDFVCTGLYLDTLKIANLTQSGPTKTITGGQYANPLLKYGKTMTCEMQDALGRAPVLVEFFGCNYDEETGVLDVTDKFPGPFAIEGDTFLIDQKTGDKVDVHIFIPQFLPDAILTFTQDAEGNAAVFDLNGTISVTKIKDGAKGEKDVFYQIRKDSWFKGMEQAMASQASYTGKDYHENGATSEYDPSAEDNQAALAKYKAEVKSAIAAAAAIAKVESVDYSTVDAVTVSTKGQSAFDTAKTNVDTAAANIIKGWN